MVMLWWFSPICFREIYLILFQSILVICFYMIHDHHHEVPHIHRFTDYIPRSFVLSNRKISQPDHVRPSIRCPETFLKFLHLLHRSVKKIGIVTFFPRSFMVILAEFFLHFNRKPDDFRPAIVNCNSVCHGRSTVTHTLSNMPRRMGSKTDTVIHRTPLPESSTYYTRSHSVHSCVGYNPGWGTGSS